MNYRKYGALVFVLAGTLPVVAACSDDDAEGAQVDSVSSGDETETGWDGETIDANVDGETPIATVTTDLERGVNRDGRVPVRFDLMRFERNGDLVELVYVLTNEHDVDDFVPYSTTVDRMNELKLVDQESQRVYLQAEDSEGDCLCTTTDIELDPGESATRYATFAGLPEDLATVDIHVHEFTPMDGVPVSG